MHRSTPNAIGDDLLPCSLIVYHLFCLCHKYSTMKSVSCQLLSREYVLPFWYWNSKWLFHCMHFILKQTSLNTSPRNQRRYAITRGLLIGTLVNWMWWWFWFFNKSLWVPLSHTWSTYKYCQSRLLEHSITHTKNRRVTRIGQHKSIQASSTENEMYIDFWQWKDL